MTLKQLKRSINYNENVLAFIRVFQILGPFLISGLAFLFWHGYTTVVDKLEETHTANVQQDERIGFLATRMTTAEGTIEDINKYLRDHATPFILPTKK